MKMLFAAGLLLIGVGSKAQPLAPEIKSGEERFSLRKEKVFNIELSSLDKKDLFLEDITLQGKTTVLTFFAEWCMPCRAELDTFNKLQQKWAKDYNVEIVAVSLDSKKNLSKMQELARERGWNFRIVWDEMEQARAQLRIRNIPHLMVINQEGLKIFETKGFDPENIPYLEGILNRAKQQ